MNKLLNFSEFALAKSEMKRVVGGGCAVCSTNWKGGGTCGSTSFSQGSAESMMREFNGYHDGYDYYVYCP